MGSNPTSSARVFGLVRGARVAVVAGAMSLQELALIGILIARTAATTEANRCVFASLGAEKTR